MKFICLYDEAALNVGTDAPDVRLMFSLFDAVAPLELPKLNVLVTDIAVDMFDVPVNTKSVAIAIDKTVVPGVVVVRTIEPVVPKAILRSLTLDELSEPVVKVKSFKLNPPSVKVNTELTEHVRSSCSVTKGIPNDAGMSTVKVSIALPFDVIVPEPSIVKSVLV